MPSFPENYLTPRHLPFNQTALGGRFVLEPPGRDDGEPGRLLVLQQGEVVIEGSRKAGVFCQPGILAPTGDDEPLYIGRWDGEPCRLLALPSDRPLPDDCRRQSLAAADPGLTLEQLSLAGIAMQVGHWHRNSRFCSRCSEPMVWLPMEWGKQCLGCKALHFPHIHPCIIVLIWRPGEILLTRKAGWPENRYSLVAGFLDMGECLEEAVVREVREETGVRVADIRYVGSQNWPFPSQLMAGFVAAYAGGEIELEEMELEDARWFSVDRLPTLPPNRSISRYLIEDFCRRAK